MVRYSAEQIYEFARAAGFSPDQAVTMTAIALAESGGNSGAHNASGEDSRGLWQINMDAHASWAGQLDLYDPLDNAQAAGRSCGSAPCLPLSMRMERQVNPRDSTWIARPGQDSFSSLPG